MALYNFISVEINKSFLIFLYIQAVQWSVKYVFDDAGCVSEGFLEHVKRQSNESNELLEKFELGMITNGLLNFE